MSLVRNLEKIANWLKQEVASDIKFKKPDDYNNTKNYEFKEVNPNVYINTPPPFDKLLDGSDHIFPFICIQLVDGLELPYERLGRFQIRFNLACWSPGLHGADVFVKHDDESFTQADEKTFDRNTEGWRDIWNFTDTLIRKLRESSPIEGIRLIEENGLEYGQFMEENQIIDAYPYFFSYVLADFEYGIIVDNKNHDDFL